MKNCFLGRLTMTIALFVIVLCPSDLLANESAPRVGLSIETIIERLAAAQGRIRSILVEYEVLYPETASIHTDFYLHRIVALKAPSDMLHITAHGHRGLSWRDDPLKLACYVGPRSYIVTRGNSAAYRTGEISPTDPALGSLPKEWAFWATGIWPLTTRAAPELYGEIPYMLPDYAAEVGTKRLRPFQEKIGDTWCHVIERSGVDVLWLDVSRGMAVMAREIYHGEPPHPSRRFVMEEHVQVYPGVWLPTTIRDIRYGDGSAVGERVAPNASERQFDIIQWRVNDLNKEVFVYKQPSGALWLNPPESEMPRVFGNVQNHLENVIRIAGMFGGGKESDRSNIWRWICLTMIGLCLICGTALLTNSKWPRASRA